ncbi:MAG: hypothetical protein ACI8ZB_001169 [Desulforhopalus sp.]|jgi:hypothetical protein
MLLNPSFFLSLFLVTVITICVNRKKLISKRTCWLLVIIFLFFLNQSYPFVTQKENSKNALYTFFVAGHVYGNPTVRKAHAGQLGLYPIFLEVIKRDIINEGIDFGFFTGDIVYRNTISEWDAVDKNIEEIGVPVHLVPGNHDVANKKLFYGRYVPNGKTTYKKFTHKGDLFIILDPNIARWNISGRQLEFLKNTLEKSSEYENIFVFFHQILWWKKNNKYRKSYLNSRYGRAKDINFWTEIEPIFKQLNNNVYMFAGDTGVAKSSLPSYDAYDNIHFVASGMGGGVNDNYVKVCVNKDANQTVNVEFVWLNDRSDLKTFIPYR